MEGCFSGFTKEVDKMSKCGCKSPENLKDKSEGCSPEQKKQCDGNSKNQCCTKKKTT
jgi:hypothetical protein